MFHSYFNAFTCSWYVSKTYHSPIKVHVAATYYIRTTPVYWSRLGRNCYGEDTYLPSSYSRSEDLFRTRSVVTDLLTLLKFQPIRCAFMLCNFGQTRNDYVATSCILLSSTAASSATCAIVDVLELLVQNVEPAGGNKERTRKKPNFVPKVVLTEKYFSKPVITILYDCFSAFCLSLVHFSILSSHGKSFWTFVYVVIYCVGARMNILMSNFDALDP